MPPRFTHIIHSLAQGELACVLQEEVSSLLDKGVICVVPSALFVSSQERLLLQIFSGPQMGGGWVGLFKPGSRHAFQGTPVYGERALCPAVVEQAWARYGRASVDLFASSDNTRCTRFYSLHSKGAPQGIDALMHIWPHELLYPPLFPSLALVPPTLSRVREYGHSLILIAPHWPAMHWLA